MNRIKGIIANITTNKGLSLVGVSAEGQMFTAIVIDTPETAHWLELDHPVYLLFKETEVVIGKPGSQKISMRNRIPAGLQSTARAIGASRQCTAFPVKTAIRMR